jgi:ABC-2 type transport system ATP-binding protein
MASGVIEIEELTKVFGDIRAVDKLSLSVPAGTICGLLGPNGAGKTTVIGSLLGLLRPTSGTVSLFGLPVQADGSRVVRRVGAIMETPAFYPYLSGRDNLRFFAGISEAAHQDEVEGLLDLVGLTERADLRVQAYSMGMKHRLGIAYALLGDPALLLLDEPTNGLDPAGMTEVRRLIRRLGEERTILLASHLLHEIEHVCDTVAILDRGRLIAFGAVNELIGPRTLIHLSTTDNDVARQLLHRLDWITSVVDQDGELLVDAPPERSGELSAALAAEGVYPTALSTSATSLERFFLDVTSEDEQ